ncbi:hypothetical protein PanWU01x14_230680 [Parasponia andersonii]|uniref:Uncharacterized protein n=1 Tax=Parasponia andersonii TaxID=3476 RepID=A0A2P5BKK3_PARAD|nr:hypothetical protein PanWU01x14_230680 [Parasponia andersonii]
MDTSPLLEDEFSPRYTPKTTPEKNDETTQTASAIPSDVPTSVVDLEISILPSAEIGDVPTSPSLSVLMVPIEPNL